MGFILLNSNEAQRGDEDSFDAMKKYASTQGYDFYYTVDKNSTIANAFGAGIIDILDYTNTNKYTIYTTYNRL